MTIGVYKITSPSGSFYVGSSVNIEGRWATHKSEMRRGSHHNGPLLRAGEKYGLESMKFQVILVCAKDDLEMYEQLLIDCLQPSYNTCSTAYRPQGNPNLRAAIIARNKAYVWTDEVRLKVAESAKERAKKHGAANKGVPMSAEQRAKLSAAMKGRRLSDEHKAKLAENCRLQNEIRFGKKK